MEDIFQYIIIIGSIIAAIVTNVSKAKQKKNASENQGPIVTSTPTKGKVTSPANEWEKWFDYIEEKIVPEKQEPVVVKQVPQDIHAQSYTTKRRPKIEVNKIESLNSIEHTDTTPQITLDSIDEIRRAIIYSEIIHRKY